VPANLLRLLVSDEGIHDAHHSLRLVAAEGNACGAT
jgi:hypothetical protein